MNVAKSSAPLESLELPDIDSILSKGSAAGGKSSKKLSVERIYQKKTQLEHILLRPDTYVGSVDHTTQLMWVYDDAKAQMVQREITYVPGLYKIFDEILVNAADNKQRDPKGMTTIKIDIDPERNMIKIWNNGKGIPVAWHAKESMYVPTLIFGHLLTSSNYDDTEKKVTGGRNGYGAKLCNIFSNKFIIETQTNDNQKAFKQVWTDNMTKTDDAKISPAKGDDFTCVTFYPDLSKFKMDKLDKDIVDLFTRRAYDMVASTRGVKVILNGVRLPIKNFKDYVELYLKDKVDENDQPLKIVHEVASDRWEVALTLSEKGFQQVSFVNSVATTKGGRHVDYVTDQIISKLLEVVKRKEKKAGVAIKPFQVKNHVWVFMNALIENPTFDSQTKENMTLQAKNFGSHCSLSEKFINAEAHHSDHSDGGRDSPAVSGTTDAEKKSKQLPRKEVMRRLRERGEPICLFGESDYDAYQRLKKLEILEPEVKGFNNDFKEAMDQVDQDYLKEILKTTSSGFSELTDVKIHDDGTTYEEVMKMSENLGKGDRTLNCDVILQYLKLVLNAWGDDLNSRPEDRKRSIKGKLASATHMQTVSYIKPLFRKLKRRDITDDILDCLVDIVGHLLRRNYLRANDAYLEMAIGNAAWPIGVTMVGIHARTGREKIFARNVAHVLNDETQRKYIQAVKRLMTQAQKFFPTAPSYSVNYEPTVGRTDLGN